MVLGLVALSLTIAFLGRWRLNGRVVEAMEHRDYNKMRVDELKALLRARGLKVGGTKPHLITRLLLDDGDSTFAASPATSSSSSPVLDSSTASASTSLISKFGREIPMSYLMAKIEEKQFAMASALTCKEIENYNIYTPKELDVIQAASIIQRWWFRVYFAKHPPVVIDYIFQVLVKDLKGKTITCMIEGTDITEVLTAKLQGKTGIPMAQQRLIFHGKKLENGVLITDYNIRRDSTLHLVLQCGLPGGARGVKQNFVKQKQKIAVLKENAVVMIADIKSVVLDLPCVKDVERMLDVLMDNIENDAVSTFKHLIHENGIESLDKVLEILTSGGGTMDSKITRAAIHLFGKHGDDVIEAYFAIGSIEDYEILFPLRVHKVDGS